MQDAQDVVSQARPARILFNGAEYDQPLHWIGELLDVNQRRKRGDIHPALVRLLHGIAHGWVVSIFGDALRVWWKGQGRHDGGGKLPVDGPTVGEVINGEW